MPSKKCPGHLCCCLFAVADSESVCYLFYFSCSRALANVYLTECSVPLLFFFFFTLICPKRTKANARATPAWKHHVASCTLVRVILLLLRGKEKKTMDCRTGKGPLTKGWGIRREEMITALWLTWKHSTNCMARWIGYLHQEELKADLWVTATTVHCWKQHCYLIYSGCPPAVLVGGWAWRISLKNIQSPQC